MVKLKRNVLLKEDKHNPCTFLNSRKKGISKEGRKKEINNKKKVRGNGGRKDEWREGKRSGGRKKKV